MSLLRCYCVLICLNGCFNVSESMSITYIQTYIATTRGPIGPKKTKVEEKGKLENNIK